MLVYGRNSCLEYLEKKEKVRKIYLQEGFCDEKINSTIGNLNIQPKYLPKYELDRLANGVHQGIIIDIGDFVYTDYHDFIDDSESFVVILDHIEDPHNLGAIIRTSEAAGVSGIIIPKDRSVEVNATVVKTSVGAIDNIPISQVTNLSRTIEDLKKEGFWIVGTALEDAVDYREIDYKGKIALVIGNEGKGISRIVKESCDYIAKIPMYGKVNSLNASVATGIMIYEVVRQKGEYLKDYKDLNDYEIMYMIAENDDTAKNIMYGKYYPIIRKSADRLSKYTKEIGIDYDDLEQAGLMALMSSMKNYNPNSSTLFYTYAVKAINRKMCNLIRISLAKKNYILNNSISLDATLSEDGANLFTFVEDRKAILPEQSLEIRELIENIKKFLYSLPIEEANILELKMNNFKIEEMSKLLNISGNNIRNKLTRIRKKMNLVIEK